MKSSILQRIIFFVCVFFLPISCCNEDEAEPEAPPLTGVHLVGEYYDAIFTIPYIPYKSIREPESIICNEIDDTRVDIMLNGLSVQDEYVHEIININVLEKQGDRWYPQTDFIENFEDVTEVNVVIALQSSTINPIVHNNIIGYASKLLQAFYDSKVSFRVALVEYSSVATVLEPFSEEVMDNSIRNALTNIVSTLEYKVAIDDDLASALNLSVELLTLSTINPDYQAIFVIGDGNNTSGTLFEDAIDNLKLNNLTNIFCIGDEGGFQSSGEPNFDKLTDRNEGFNGFYDFITTPDRIEGFYDTCYKQIPNVYNMSYIRYLSPPNPIELQWNITTKAKK